MKASAFEFRLRFLIHGVIFALGFIAPWNYLVHQDAASVSDGFSHGLRDGFSGGLASSSGFTVGFGAGFWSHKAIWLPAALAIERTGWLSLTGASNLLLAFGILFALAAAMLRTWAAAWLGPSVVKDGRMHASPDRSTTSPAISGIVTGGPFRYLRNPLYLGTFLHTLALALLMPLSGAIFAVLAIGFEQLRLIGAEEAFLASKLGQPYLDYKARVPSLLPSFKSKVPPSGSRPGWPMAFICEIYMWGVAIAFASVGSRYNAQLVIQGVLIAVGLSLVARAFLPLAGHSE